MRCVGRVLWVAWGCGAAVADCRVAREAWLATPRSTTRFTSTVFPHGFGCLDWPHAGVSGGRARHSTPPSRPANKNPETKQRQVCSPKATDTKARPPNQFNNQTTRRPREAQRPMQSKPSPPNQPGGATGPTSISLFVLVCVVWVCSPSATTLMVFVAWLCLGLCLLFVWLGGRGGPRTQPDNTKRFTFGWLGGQTIEVNLVVSCGLASPATRPRPP